MPLAHPLPGEPPHDDSRSFLLRIDLSKCRMQLTGRLDRHTVHLLHDAMSALLRAEGKTWVIHASQVTAFDRMGLHAIAAAYRRALRHNRHMTLTGTSHSLERELSRLRLDRHLLDGDGGPAAVPVPHA